MLNKSELIDRIREVMEQHELNASSFAETIGVQRSSISHILSGRNKPSLEFLAKIEAAFEEVSFEWLLKGKPNKAAISNPSPTLAASISFMTLGSDFFAYALKGFPMLARPIIAPS
ncbi:MAG: helix-turn-helix transcriptional regulator, partial [Candidatus Arcticimaribacter sp.]